ncbi:glycosyltransferase [Sulfurospirillum sp. 'SP']|nr:glycosyltransferase [Sulfurospirillum sp. 'SP']WNZ00221.1 glycosyltransferase [Sulfurospirillum sp. 'SP']
MKIVVDLQACQSGSRLGGIGRYSMNLAEGLIRQSGQHELFFILNNLFPETIEKIYTTLGKSIPKSHIRVFNIPGPVNESNRDNFSRMHIAEILREKFIYDLQPDIVFVSSLIEGLGDDVVSSVGKVISGEKTSVTLYDLIPLVEQEKYLVDPISKQHYFRKIEDLKKAGSLLAISEFSKQQAIDVLGLESNIITTISSAIDDKFKPIQFSLDAISKVHHVYGIMKKFLLFTGSFDQRKNHERLIKAFARLPQKIRSEYQLVIIGNGWDGIYAHFKNVALREGLSDQDIIFAGHVPDHDLLVIYNTASLFVFPSLSEGFGLPVLEAMSCGIPTIGSNTTSIPEVIGLEDALFDPYDIESITSKIYQVLTNQAFQNTLKEHGIHFSKNFSWDNSAKKAISAFEELHKKTQKSFIYDMSTIDSIAIEKLSSLVAEEKLSESEIVQVASAVEMNCLASRDLNTNRKVGLISTWNTRCGIAMYSKHLFANHEDKLTIFAPYDNNLVETDTKNVIRSWNIGEDNLQELVRKIDEQDITTIVIQPKLLVVNMV